MLAPSSNDPMSSAALSAAKTQLRSIIKQRLKGVSQESISQQSKSPKGARATEQEMLFGGEAQA